MNEEMGEEGKLARVIEALKEYDPERIILFGSQARGEEDSYSDLDLVLIKETQERFLDRLEKVFELVQPDFALDVLVYTPEEWDRMKDEGNPFVEMVLTEGKIIYERPPRRS
ncbi:MAG: nucleotidyltransferase domain-containing protein [Anaerolineae bacterium]